MLSRFAVGAEDIRLTGRHRRRPYRKADLHEHLLAEGPKRILALDGGGVRSALSIAILEKIEDILRRRHGNYAVFRLSHYFDLIGGTSTGSILAAGLASNAVSVAELREIYSDLVNFTFRRGGRLDAPRLEEGLSRLFGTRTMGGEMATGLAVLARRLDGDTSLVFHNNPEGPNFDDQPEKAMLGYARYPVANVLRASVAYPGQFHPVSVKLTRLPHLEEGLFVDAGFTPFNNPAFQLFLLATLPKRGFGWNTGDKRLLVTSVGTGSLCNELPATARRAPSRHKDRHGLNFMIDDAEHTGELLMQLLSEPAAPQQTIGDFGDLRDIRLTPEPQCAYQRYQAKLTPKALLKDLGLGLSNRQLGKVRNMLSRDGFQIAYEIGQAVADAIVREEHFPADFDLEPLRVPQIISRPESANDPAPVSADHRASASAQVNKQFHRGPRYRLPSGLPRR